MMNRSFRTVATRAVATSTLWRPLVAGRSVATMSATTSTGQLSAAHTTFGSSAALEQRRWVSNAEAARNEAELVQVLSTKPRHVARRVRQMLVGANRRIAQFRNTVTFLMIVLQTKLQAKEIQPADAAIVIEGVMRECVKLHQADMAHLLFRAALRFRKFDVSLTVACVRLLFDSYRGTDSKDLMKQLAQEMQGSPEHRALAMAAFIYAGMPLEANALRQAIPPSSMTTEDYIGLVEGYAAQQDWRALDAVMDDVLTSQSAKVQAGEVFSTAIRATQRSSQMQENLFRAAYQQAMTVSPEAIASVCRTRLESVTSYEGALQVEEDLKRELRIETVGTAAITAIIGKASVFLTRNFDKGDEVMLMKVDYLKSFVDAQIANDEVAEIEGLHVQAILKGYGVLGKIDEMMAAFNTYKRKAPAVVDHLVYLEVMKWQSHSGNVRAVLDLKREMEENGVYHHPRVFSILFRALDRFYPKLTEQYYRELRTKVQMLDAPMYAAVVRAFLDIRRYDIVEEVYNEMKQRAEQNHAVYNDSSILVLLRAYRGNRLVFDNIIQVANKLQFLSNPAIQGRVVEGYATQKRFKEMDAFIASLPSKTSPVYIALLHAYSEKQDLDAFRKILEDMKRNNIEFTDVVFQTVSVCCSRWRDTTVVREILNGVRGMVGIKTCRYYATAAISCHRLGDFDAVEELWNELRSSGLPISMETFNHFLGLHVQRHNVELMQDVLRTMMERVPPNPVTTTTVVDMLGKMGRLSEMEVLIDEMSRSTEVQPTLVTYHHAMHAYARHGDVVKMEAMRSRLRRDGLKENNFTFNILFDGYGRAKRYEHLPELMNERIAMNVAMDDTGYAVLLNMYAKGRMADEVKKTVDAIMSRSAARSSERAADGQQASRHPEAGLSARMTAAIAEAYSYIHDLANVEKYVQLLLSHPTVSETHIETVFLIYHRLRDVTKLDMMLNKYGGSEFVYNVCVAAFAKMQNHERVAELLEVMKRKDLALHTNTAIILSSLLLKAGKVDLAQAVLRWKTREGTQLSRSEREAENAKLKGKGGPKLSEPTLETDTAAVLEEETAADVVAAVAAVTAAPA
jgi:pentatricopeptide repeat protein